MQTPEQKPKPIGQTADEFKKNVFPKLETLRKSLEAFFYANAERGRDGKILQYPWAEDIGKPRVFRIAGRTIYFQSLKSGKRWVVPTLEGRMLVPKFAWTTIEQVDGTSFTSVYIFRHMIRFGRKTYKPF